MGVNLVIDNFLCSVRYVTSILHLIAIGPLFMSILHFEDVGDTVLFGCSSARRVSHFNDKVPQGVSTHI